MAMACSIVAVALLTTAVRGAAPGTPLPISSLVCLGWVVAVSAVCDRTYVRFQRQTFANLDCTSIEILAVFAACSCPLNKAVHSNHSHTHGSTVQPLTHTNAPGGRGRGSSAPPTCASGAMHCRTRRAARPSQPAAVAAASSPGGRPPRPGRTRLWRSILGVCGEFEKNQAWPTIMDHRNAPLEVTKKGLEMPRCWLRWLAVDVAAADADAEGAEAIYLPVVCVFLRVVWAAASGAVVRRG